jgi:4-hydroxybenzoate polyprenyltransferase
VTRAEPPPPAERTSAAPRPPRASSVGRLAEYLAEMFPPAVLVPFGVANFFAVYFALEATTRPGPLALGWRAAAGAASAVLLTLLMRVYDELKDVETDLRLGRAGDPRYKDRAIVTGRVRVEDIVRLRWTVTAAVFALNAPLGAPLPLAAFLVTFFAMWLSFHWFFAPSISKSLILAFVTHNPISILLLGYIVAVYARDFGWADLDREAAAALVLGLWAPVAAWETSRKIRVPEDETSYQTYSLVLGWRTAALVPAGFVALSAALLVFVARRAGLGWGFPAVVLAAGAVAVGRCLLFRIAPSRARAKLEPFAQLYALAANVGLVAALALARGVRAF